ncbi:MAG: helix-turn-helix domain-containing protein [Hyphomicrobiaceae bacterium]
MSVQDKTDINVYVGRRLKALREARSVDPEKLAAILSISMAKYSEYELGRAQISAGTLLDLCCFFDLPVTYFFSDFEYHTAMRDGQFPSESDRSST